MFRKLVLILVALVLVGGVFWYGQRTKSTGKPVAGEKIEKKAILRFAVVADSENDNELLGKALRQAQGKGVNFVIGLGDWTSIGTVEQLEATKKVFDNSGLKYYLTAGDHDDWDSRDKQNPADANFQQVFGNPTQIFDREGVLFVIVDNSDIYKGIDSESWGLLNDVFSVSQGQNKQISENFKFQIETFSSEKTNFKLGQQKLTFVFAHKTPFHPQSKHVMGEDNEMVAKQAADFMSLMEKSKVDGFFSGDLHFFAQFKSPSGTVKMTTIGAVSTERNFQGPRFGVVTVWDDYSWDVSDEEIR